MKTLRWPAVRDRFTIGIKRAKYLLSITAILRWTLGVIVKRIVQVSLLALSLAATASYAVQAQSKATRRKNAPEKTTSLSGVVGAQGRTVLGEGNRVWAVANPAVLAAIEGRSVTIWGHSGSALGEIVLSVVRLREVRTTPKLDDAAFRR